MQKLLASAAAIALGLAASAASAAQFMGTIEEVDETARNITVSSPGPDQDMIFALAANNTVGATLADLQAGDKVRVFYSEAAAEGTAPVNAIQVDKMAKVEGTIEEIDQSAGTLTVDGEEYAFLESAVVGVPLADLEEGDQVTIVSVDASSGQSNAIEITKIE